MSLGGEVWDVNIGNLQAFVLRAQKICYKGITNCVKIEMLEKIGISIHHENICKICIFLRSEKVYKGSKVVRQVEKKIFRHKIFFSQFF